MPAQRDRGKPQVFIETGREVQIVEEVVRAIGLPAEGEGPEADVYCRLGKLVRVLPSESPKDPPGTVGIVGIPQAVVRELIVRAVDLVRAVESKAGGAVAKPANPPDWLVKSVAERGFWGGLIRPIEGICTAPTIRPDGSILQAPGYDPTTALIFRPECKFPTVPESPTATEVAESVERLLTVVADFPFEAEADRSAWLAMVLSMVARPLVAGCVPLFAVTANVRGAGKSLLIDAASLIAYGATAARQVFTTDREEQRKLITSAVKAALPSVLFDNLGVRLSGDSLDAVLTSSTWQDRNLGFLTISTVSVSTVFCATGNNLQFGSDIARRVLPIRLMSPEECPEDRTGFRHPDLLGFVRENRAGLAVDALTILRGFIAAGRPSQPGGQFGSFEEWSQTIRGAIVWTGLADPMETRETARAQDDDRDTLGLLITALDETDTEGTGLTVKQLEKAAEAEDASEALLALVGIHCPKGFNSRTVGELLKKFRGRNAGGRSIEGKPGHGRVMRWRVVGGGGCGGSGGSVLSVSSQKSVSYSIWPEAGETDPPHHPHHPGSADVVEVF